MKAIRNSILILALCLVAIPSFGQKNIGDYDRVNVKTLLNIMADSFKWEGTLIYKDSLYYTQIQGDSARFKQLGSNIWSGWVGGNDQNIENILNEIDNLYNSVKIFNNYLSINTTLIKGTVTWSSGLTFNVTDCSYYIMGQFDESDAIQITLDVADQDDPRIDVIYADTLGNIGKLTGIPSDNPSEPLVDPLSQIKLTIITVDAGATAPGGIESNYVYSENTEWVGSGYPTMSTIIAFDNTNNPYAGDSCTSIFSFGNIGGSIIKFTKASTRTFRYNEQLVFYIKSSRAWNSGNAISLLWSNGNTIISGTKTLGLSDYYDFDCKSTSWQRIVIPIKDFNSLSGKVGDTFWIMFMGSWPSITIQLDDIEIQSGLDIESNEYEEYDSWVIGNSLGVYRHDTVKIIGDSGISAITERVDQDNIKVTITGTTYTISAEPGTGGAWIKVSGSDGSADSLKLVAGTNMSSIVRTDANTITFNSAAGSGSGATYTLSAVNGTGGAWLKILGSDGSADSVKLAAGTNMSSIVVTDSNTITLNATAGEGTTTGLVEDMSFEFADIEAGTSQTYTLDIFSSYGYTISTAYMETDTGTLTGIAIQINGISVTNLANVTADSSVDATNSTGVNTVAVGDRITIVTSTGFTGMPTVLRGKLKITRI